jgi:hypothetical protein
MHNADLSSPHSPQSSLTNIEFLLAKGDIDSSLGHGTNSSSFDKDWEVFTMGRGNAEKLECDASDRDA